jgi:hypothetical protein
MKLECGKCGVNLTENNCYPSDWKRGGYICKTCRQEARKLAPPSKVSEYTLTNSLKLKGTIIDEYGGKCECCGETAWQFLTIDHIGNWGSQHRKQVIGPRGGKNIYQWLKKNGYPKDDFRLLCMNCNACIGFHGFCPHQIPSSSNCVGCGVLLDSDNHFSFHAIDEVSLCKRCVLERSIRRPTAQDKYDDDGMSLEQRRLSNKSYVLKSRLTLIEGYGGVCVCCGETDYMFLTIDHINNDGFLEKMAFNNVPGAFYRSLVERGFPTDNYRLLCSNCNSCRGAYGVCYHELCRELGADTISIDEYKGIIIQRKRAA